jgi:uncharacterized membrane protein YqgA involved in biofilm formation
LCQRHRDIRFDAGRDDGRPEHINCKAFLDFFTATIFATTLGIAVAAICVPMLLIQLALATCAALILPLTTPQ